MKDTLGWRVVLRREVKSEEEALKLFDAKAHPIDEGLARTLDFAAKDAKRERENGYAYLGRVIAAKSFESLAGKSADPVKLMKEAAFSYDRAARCAYDLGFSIANLRCRIRSCRLNRKLYKLTQDEIFIKDLEFSQGVICEIARS